MKKTQIWCPFWPCLLLVSFLFIFVGLISLFIRLFLLVLLALLHSFRGRFPHLKHLYCYRSGGTLTQKLKPLNPSQGTSASEGSAASEGSFRIFSFFSFLPSVQSIRLYDTLTATWQSRLRLFLLFISWCFATSGNKWHSSTQTIFAKRTQKDYRFFVKRIHQNGPTVTVVFRSLFHNFWSWNTGRGSANLLSFSSHLFHP